MRANRDVGFGAIFAAAMLLLPFAASGQQCPPEPPPAPGGGSCPPECTGGCAAGTCIIECSVVGQCGNATLVCPAGFDCHVRCTATSTCQRATIECPTGARCDIDCAGISSCQRALFRCADDGACDIECSNTSACQTSVIECDGSAACDLTCSATSTCQRSEVHCGDGACSTTCTGLASGIAEQVCGSACLCEKGCRETRVGCGNDTTPPTITCPASVVAATEPGTCSAAVAFGAPQAGDACGLAQVGCDHASGDRFGLGETVVTCTAADSAGNSASCTFSVTVEDREPPVIDALASDPDALWPPDHRLVPVDVLATAIDNCDDEPACAVDGVRSDEPVDGPGDGHTDPDWAITGDLSVDLRSERAGGGDGRVYTIDVTCADAAGNTAAGTTDVTVPHDQRRR